MSSRYNQARDASSVFLFATNTLLLRALSVHLPAADGWLGILYRGVVGMLMVAVLVGFYLWFIASNLPRAPF